MGNIKIHSLINNIFGVLVTLILFSSVVFAQNDTPLKNYKAIDVSVDETLATELKNIEKLKNQHNQAGQSKKKMLEDINAYKIQLPILNNQLIQPETTVKVLEKSWLEIQTVIRDLSERKDEFSEKQNTVAPLLVQNKGQVELIEKQIFEIQSDAESGKEFLKITDQLKALLKYLSEKQELLVFLNTTYSETIEMLVEKKQTFKELSDKFDESIKKKKKQELLERKSSLISIGLKQIFEDFKQIPLQLQPITTRLFWSGQLELIWASGGLYFVSFVLLFFIIQVLIFRMRQYLVRLKEHPALKDRFWNLLTVSIIQKSIFLLGSSLFLYSYAQIGPLQSKPPIIWAGLNMLLVWLFSEGCIDALNLYCGEGATTVPRKPAFSFRLLISFARWFGLSYILFSWLGTSNTVLTVWRLSFEICLYAWTIFFWNNLQKTWPSNLSERSPRMLATIISLKFLSFSIVFTSLILEFFGYGQLALYWLTSWGRTAVVVMWSFLFFFVLREWNPKVEKDLGYTDDVSDTPKKSIRWAMIQLLMLTWFGGGIIFLVLAWGGKQAVLLGIFEFLRHTYQVGTMRFSLLGFIIAILVLLLTQAITRVWQSLFREKILKQSGMEEGLQDSIATISVYVIWSIGILIALNVFGFNATTLTVVLGALGIGLGFGLQAIFNNFISGIILLFERPIQVGDDIEVNGIWARVRKINVRATVVQTFDNASLIIPNADLISAQVTNWSFKDKRLRRTVEVGVAYGSDIELVHKTLLEVAEKVPRVLRLPKPDVIFKNFGDNSLIFWLRFWTRVDYFLAVETDVRFEIDRLFRERKIEISFPQRDIHIRSDFKHEKTALPQKDLEVVTEGNECKSQE